MCYTITSAGDGLVLLDIFFPPQYHITFYKEQILSPRHMTIIWPELRHMTIIWPELCLISTILSHLRILDAIDAILSMLNKFTHIMFLKATKLFLESIKFLFPFLNVMQDISEKIYIILMNHSQSISFELYSCNGIL